MGQRIDDANDLDTLKHKAKMWDAFCKLIESMPDYQEWLKERGGG